MSEVTPLQLIATAKDVILRDGWGQGHYTVHEPGTNNIIGRCMKGAVFAAANELGLKLNDNTIYAAFKLVEEKLETEDLVRFNDDKTRTKEEVLEALTFETGKN
jgi:hypothetical protein